MTELTGGPFREPAWLTAKIDQRVALMTEALGGTWPRSTAGIAMITLTEPAEGEAATSADFDRWDRSCDRCGKFCPDEVQFYSGQSVREQDGVRIIVTFGVCDDCRRVE